MSSRSRKYGGRFSRGFAAYLQDQELADVTIVAPSGEQNRAHMLLLSYHSEFFRRAFNSEFKEKDERKVVMGFDDPAGVWPLMLEFFYTDEITLSDDTVLPLLAMSRELMVKSIEDYCSDYAQNSLEPNNAIRYLNQAVQFNCESFRESCVALVAEGFPASFNKPTDGLPSEVMMEVLIHPALVAQTEEQVLTFVMNYVKRHNLSPETVRQLYEQVRFPFLSNERLASLINEESVPKDLLLSGMAIRFNLIDHPERLAAFMPHVQGGAVNIPSTSHGPTLSPHQARNGSTSTARSPVWANPWQMNSASSPSMDTDSVAANALAAAGIPFNAIGVPSYMGSTSATHNATSATSPAPAHRASVSGTVVSACSPSRTSSVALPPAPLQLTSSNNQASSSNNSNGGSSSPAAIGFQVIPRKTYICSIEYGLPGGSEYACVPLHEVWDELVSQLHVRVSGDVVEGDAQSILRTNDSDSGWFMVSSEASSQQPVWVEIELPPHMRVVELTKFTFSHGINFANHMFPYGMSDTHWLQMKGLYTQVSEGENEPFFTLRTIESSASAVQYEYTVGTDGSGARVPPWRRLRISTCEEQSGGTIRLSLRTLRLFGRVEVSLIREGPPGSKDVLALWRKRKEAPSRSLANNRKAGAGLVGLTTSQQNGVSSNTFTLA